MCGSSGYWYGTFCIGIVLVQAATVFNLTSFHGDSVSVIEGSYCLVHEPST